MILSEVVSYFFADDPTSYIYISQVENWMIKQFIKTIMSEIRVQRKV